MITFLEFLNGNKLEDTRLDEQYSPEMKKLIPAKELPILGQWLNSFGISVQKATFQHITPLDMDGVKQHKFIITVMDDDSVKMFMSNIRGQVWQVYPPHYEENTLTKGKLKKVKAAFGVSKDYTNTSDIIKRERDVKRLTQQGWK